MLFPYKIVPDEQSNLNLPPSAHRPNNRRRGRRGGRGRGRGPRPTDEAGSLPPSGELSHPAGDADTGAEAAQRPEGQTDLPQSADAATAGPVSASTPPAPAFEESQRPPRPHAPSPPRPERRPEPPAPKPWVKPADFRPAETSAIHQAVVHATEIAEGLKILVDRIDEILELVEVAERQKLADERELDNLRRALRRIQPPRQSQGNEPHRGQSRGEGRPRPEYAPARHEPSQVHHEPAHEPAPEVPANARAEAEACQESESDFHREPHSEPQGESPSDSQGEDQAGDSHAEP